MSVYASVKAWLKSQGSPRWQIISGGIILFLSNAAFSIWMQYSNESAANDRAAKQEILNRLAEMRLAAMDFQTYAGAYVGAVLEGGDINSNEKTLIESIMRQHTAVELSKGLYSQETVASAARYQAALAKFNSIVPKSSSVLEMAPFWEAASEVLLARDEFFRSLEKQKSDPSA